MSGRFDGTVAVVTGAGRGIGRAVAEAFARAGAAVVLAARHLDEISAVASRIGAAGARTLVVTTDISRPEDCTALVAHTVERFGRIDALVTCAAAPPAVGPSETLPLATWHGVIDVDLTGTFLTCQAVGRHMLAHGGGGIVNVVSMHALATYPERAAYAAAKAGVAGLTRALAVEWAGRGVSVNAVAPGPVRGPRLDAFLADDPASEARMVARTPAGRLAEPADVAAAVLFLCAPEARHVTGQTVAVDGGWTSNAWWGDHAEPVAR